ncbi:retrovirus-related pol polyprotein from transposon TNT 1-94 [Tanacetum coccineum]
MSTLGEYMIVVGADNHPPMIDKPQYESWKSRMELYIQEDGTFRPKTYKELFDKEKLQADCDLKATNIVLQGLPPDVYAIVNHHKVAKDIWDKVKLLMQDTSLTKKERKVKLYDEFDKFTYVKGETLYEYYLRFAQLVNYMNIIKMTMQTTQANTKFLNIHPLEWGKFVTDVKLAKDLHTSSYDQLYSYLLQHKHTRALIRACEDCQVHKPVPRNPQQKLTPVMSSWPFYKWGIDIAGPFLEGPEKVKFLIVAIDYFTKWIEAKPVATIMGNQVKKIMWENIVCRFELPGEIISDNGK